MCDITIGDEKKFKKKIKNHAELPASAEDERRQTIYYSFNNANLF